MAAYKTSTVTEIFKYLVNRPNTFAVIGTDEYTNREALAFLFAQDRDKQYNVQGNGDHIFISEVKA